MKILDILQRRFQPQHSEAQAFAPANIALVKYWGKRDTALNLPLNSSVSISLGHLGATTRIVVNHLGYDRVFLANNLVAKNCDFHEKIVRYLDLMRQDIYFDVYTTVNIPIASGLASSAAGFAALAQALNELFAWELSSAELSILARLGSGSAARSIAPGFMYWQRGERPDGLDSFAKVLPYKWEELRIGVVNLTDKAKEISSREAMQLCVATSPFMTSWAQFCEASVAPLISYIENKDFTNFGSLSEHIATTMHGLMLSAKPSIMYMLPITIAWINKIKKLRQAGLEVYFTEDAGANLKLIFKAHDTRQIEENFDNLQVINPWIM